MTLTYKFDPEDDYGFEKDLSQKDLKEYFESLTTEEKVEAIETAFKSFSKDDQHEILAEMDEPNFACPDFARWIEEDIDYCLDLFTEAEHLFEDELHDYFEDEAYKEWSYEEQYKDPSDPYEQRGLNRSIFD
jgi:hypothetical protein